MNPVPPRMSKRMGARARSGVAGARRPGAAAPTSTDPPTAAEVFRKSRLLGIYGAGDRWSGDAESPDRGTEIGAHANESDEKMTRSASIGQTGKSTVVVSTRTDWGIYQTSTPRGNCRN